MDFVKTLLVSALCAAPAQEINLNQAFALANTTLRMVKVRHPAISAQSIAQSGSGLGEQIDALYINKDLCSKDIVNNLIDKARARLIFGTNVELKYLPFSLGTLLPHQLCNIFYFESLLQEDGWTCGYRTIFNAAAINHLLTNRRDLTYQNLSGQASTYEDFNLDPLEWFCTRYLSNLFPEDQPSDESQPHEEHLLTLAQCPLYNLNVVGGSLNFHILGYFGDLEAGISPEVMHDSFVSHDQVLNQRLIQFGPAAIKNLFLQRLRTHFYTQYVNANARGALHFACVLPWLNGGKLDKKKSHWILISIVKLVDRNPIMIILDSKNYDIENGAGIVGFIEFLYHHFM
jgi:hypothetical protein